MVALAGWKITTAAATRSRHKVASQVEAIRELATAGISDPQIAKRLGMTTAAVRSTRRRNRIVSPIGDRRGVDWDSVDWSQSNREIAIAIGAHVKTVAVKRRSLQMPLLKRSAKPVRAVRLLLPLDVAEYLETVACADLLVAALLRQNMNK